MELTFEQKTDIGFEYVLDLVEPCSCFGAAKLKNTSVFSSKESLTREFDNIEKILKVMDERAKAIQVIDICFMQMKDISKTVEKCKQTSLTDVELFEIKRFLLLNRDLYPAFKELNDGTDLWDIDFADLSDALKIVDPDNTGVASFFVSDAASPELAKARAEKKKIENEIRLTSDPARKEDLLIQRTFIAAKEEEAEMAVKREMSKNLIPFLDDITKNTESAAKLDLTVRKAVLSRKRQTCRPVISEEAVSFENMTNPKIADVLAECDKTFTPVSITAKKGATVITGANMGGKSVALKTLALNTLLALCGFFPFAEKASVPMLDNIYMISEDLESVDKGLSSFGGEIIKFNEIAGKINSRSMALFDEFARGTNPDEGAAIVRAVTKWLNGKEAVSVLTTHYDGVAPLAGSHFQVIGLKNVDFNAVKKEIDAVSKERSASRIAEYMNYGLYKVTDNSDCPRDALSICKLLDMDKEIVGLAEKYY